MLPQLDVCINAGDSTTAKASVKVRNETKLRDFVMAHLPQNSSAKTACAVPRKKGLKSKQDRVRRVATDDTSALEMTNLRQHRQLD